MPIGSGGGDLTGIEMVGFNTDSRSQNLKILGDWGLSGNSTMPDSQHACCFITTRVTLAAQAQAPNGGEDSHKCFLIQIWVCNNGVLLRMTEITRPGFS